MSMSIINVIIPFAVNHFTYICNLPFYGGVFPNAVKIYQYTKMVQRMNLTTIDPCHYCIYLKIYLIIIIMVIFKCYFSGELIALS